MDVLDLLSSLAGESAFPDLEGQARTMAMRDAANQEIAAERARQSAIVRDALDNPAGRRFLEWLHGKAFMLPTPLEIAEMDAARLGLIAARIQGRQQLFATILAALCDDDNKEARDVDQ